MISNGGRLVSESFRDRLTLIFQNLTLSESFIGDPNDKRQMFNHLDQNVLQNRPYVKRGCTMNENPHDFLRECAKKPILYYLVDLKPELMFWVWE